MFEKHSICPFCKHKLSWLDLVPVASFFILGRRCRYCKRPISWVYPLVELVTAILFTAVYLNECGMWNVECGFNFNIQYSIFNILFQLAFVSMLIVIFVYDLKHYLILDKVVYPAAALAAVFQAMQGRFVDGLYGVLLLSGFFGLLYVVSRGRWIGMGDVKLGLFLGMLAPFPETIAVFFLAYFSGAATSLFLMGFGIKALKDRVPFGTFLTFAALTAMLWGKELVEWYFNLIGIYSSPL
ncbi:MAG: hypothetical protein A2751_00170 [Candidatus Doudnabacteria bacterium RIFCSPHIGHO2_01_FULL_46_14]|uniref:Prepilin peptidase n=1 Tax=Candidatus Doudnabacteria bacterium RIFCSPHIGHO2_01_FULL_46_14 TaxID=1817824 RepID=A0A1F5NN42_9BACT|nr:MAG: hypothetical protein A2751_00170 [Candidatus Doudnabacteria bacterium RIFCSPHIGHO2_01_FULL_46_14]